MLLRTTAKEAPTVLFDTCTGYKSKCLLWLNLCMSNKATAVYRVCKSFQLQTHRPLLSHIEDRPAISTPHKLITPTPFPHPASTKPTTSKNTASCVARVTRPMSFQRAWLPALALALRLALGDESCPAGDASCATRAPIQCVRWRQTAGCDPKGTREKSGDKEKGAFFSVRTGGSNPWGEWFGQVWVTIVGIV